MAVSTKLPLAFVLVTPMCTNNGEYIDISFAAGHLMLVNLILGLSYLQFTGSIADLNDTVAVMSKVGHAQFPTTYCVPQCSVPLILSRKWQHVRDTLYKGIHAELNGTKAQVRYVSATMIPDPTTKGS